MTNVVTDAMDAGRKKVMQLERDVRDVFDLEAKHKLTQQESQDAVRKIEERIAAARHEAAVAGMKALADTEPAFQTQRRSAAQRVEAAFVAFLEPLRELRELEMQRSAQTHEPELRGKIFAGGLAVERHLHRVLRVDEALLRHFQDAIARECAPVPQPKPPRVWEAVKNLLPASAR